uniref:Uncharacterized protein n=1 Tax=Equus asinus TaxID=9793 RepID=A0A9L0J4Z2_EQUAS
MGELRPRGGRQLAEQDQTPCGAGLRPQLSRPPPLKPMTRPWPPSATPRVVQLCYGPSAYSPAGSLDLAPSLEAPGPDFRAYPTEDFPSQPLYPSPVLSEEEDLLLDSPTLEVSDSESDEALMAGSEGEGIRGRGPQEAAPVPVPAGAADARGHARVRVVGGAGRRGLPVLLEAQGAAGAPLGPAAEGQPQAHDLPEAGARPAQLRQDRRDPQGQAQAHLPVQQ